LFIRIIRNRRVKHLPRNYAVFAHEWSDTGCRVILPGEDSGRFDYLRSVSEGMREDLSRLRMIIMMLDEKGDYSAEDVVHAFRGCGGKDSLLNYSERLGDRLRELGRERTARAYRSVSKSLILFNSGADVMLADINITMVNAYEKELMGRGLALNTISFYMRNLRAIYYRAIKDRIIVAQSDNPFGQVYTGVAPTEKRALTKQETGILFGLEESLSGRVSGGKSSEFRGRSGSISLHHSLLYFMFCYHARGMSFVDLAYLKKSQIKDGKMIYMRRKTGQLLTVKVTAPMRKIINYFRNRCRRSPYLLPIIDPQRGNERRQYESGLRIQNTRLSLLAKMAGLEKHVTTHVSRHSWATIAKREMIDIALISEALGHNNIKTTITYLDSFESSKMDRLSDKMSSVISKAA
jgi:tyrosine site-specific recombinase